MHDDSDDDDDYNGDLYHQNCGIFFSKLVFLRRNQIDEFMMTTVQTHGTCVIAKLFIVYDVLQFRPLHCDKIHPT